MQTDMRKRAFVTACILDLASMIFLSVKRIRQKKKEKEIN